MERNLFVSALPKTKLDAVDSLGVYIFTNIQLVDYDLNSSSAQNRWIRDFSDNLSNTAKSDLKLLRTVFAHGVILRDFYIKKNFDLTMNWDAFIDWWKQLDKSAMMELIIYGIKETIDYYYKYLPRMPIVEEVMQEVYLDEKQLQDPDNRKKAVKAVLLSWSVSVEEADNIAEDYDNVVYIKESIIRLLHSFWNAGLERQWEEKQEKLAAWARQQKSLLAKTYRTNGEAIFEITGLYPDTTELENINRAEFLTFIPVSNMERLLSFIQFDKHVYLMFDPQVETGGNKEKLADYYAAFEGLGDKTRLQIIDLLTENKEMFAQQMIQQLNLKQSTVSRHLNQLQQSNLVMVHQEGNTKYFSLNRNELQKVAESFHSFLNRERRGE
ncbi:ArsR/SmtB family transcription factor [Oceanobacillus jeddahense]|uniref:Metalloregulator ArsR/SmtB family transcription factor n=1 Tax=Oceanobacillus jeddahense TaxID=1462527 RepID=A0ABY5JQP2_9BACI|nr:metalloregulator ArsR/SmtB family transcription factor [Oceanobacillus jeddahense]UUI01177.1 metalloregulator ArsR/SmtB family transcription factor [Oceanobacillus jeddahense]